jgi:hypothetical protein
MATRTGRGPGTLVLKKLPEASQFRLRRPKRRRSHRPLRNGCPTAPRVSKRRRRLARSALLAAHSVFVWCNARQRERVVEATRLPIALHGHARYNIANALAALAALRCMGHGARDIASALASFVSDAKSYPLQANQFELDGVRLVVDDAHNVSAYRALCAMARSLLGGRGRLLGVVTSPGDRAPRTCTRPVGVAAKAPTNWWSTSKTPEAAVPARRRRPSSRALAVPGPASPCTASRRSDGRSPLA